MATRKHDVFLSYSSKDTETMQRVRKTLQKAGFMVWVDETNLKKGTASWRQAIADALESTGCLVVLFSPDAKKSRWVNAELEYSEHQGLTPFPILVRGSTKDAVPFGYSSAQWADITNPANYDTEMGELVDAIREDLKDKPVVAQPPTTASPAYQRQPPPTIDFNNIIQRQRVSPYFARVASGSAGLGAGPVTPAPELTFWQELWFDVLDLILPWLSSTVIWLPLFIPMVAVATGQISTFPDEISVPYLQDTVIETAQFGNAAAIAIGILWLVTALMFESYDEQGMFGGLVGIVVGGSVCIGLGLLMETSFDRDFIGALLSGGSIYVALIFGVVGLAQTGDIGIDAGDFVIGVATGVGLLAPSALVVGTRGMPQSDLGSIGMFALVYFVVLAGILAAGGTLATVIYERERKAPLVLLGLLVAAVAYASLLWIYLLDGWQQFVA